MKTKHFIIALFSITLTVVSCSESFLNQPPYGSVITQEQYEKLDGALEGSMRGIYSMMYAVSDHDLFGKRGIDLSTDILSGDIAYGRPFYTRN